MECCYRLHYRVVPAIRYTVNRESRRGMLYARRMTMGTRVRALRIAAGFASQEALAKAVRARGGDLSQSQVSALENDEVKQPRSLRLIAAVLGTTEDYILTGQTDGAESNVRGIVSQQEPEVRRDDAPLPKVRRWYVTLSTGTRGEWLLYSNRLRGEFPREPKYEFMDVFKVEVIDDRNAPIYRMRDILTISQDKLPIAGEDCLFSATADTEGAARGLLGMLVRIGPTEWVMQQYGEKDEITLQRTQWPHAWPVVNREMRP